MCACIQAVQRQQAGYEHVKEDTVWSMEHLQQWLNTNWKHPNDGTPIPPDFVSKALTVSSCTGAMSEGILVWYGQSSELQFTRGGGMA